MLEEVAALHVFRPDDLLESVLAYVADAAKQVELHMFLNINIFMNSSESVSSDRIIEQDGCYFGW